MVMYDGYGSRFGYSECKKVIDVSAYNGNINWYSVKASGVDGAILRITSFSGGYMHEDDRFASVVSDPPAGLQAAGGLVSHPHRGGGHL